MLENILKSVLSKVPLFLPRLHFFSPLRGEPIKKHFWSRGAFFCCLRHPLPLSATAKNRAINFASRFNQWGGGRGGGPSPGGGGGLDTRRKGGEGLRRAKEINCIHTSRSLAQWEKGRGERQEEAVGSQFHSSFGYLGRPKLPTDCSILPSLFGPPPPPPPRPVRRHLERGKNLLLIEENVFAFIRSSFLALPPPPALLTGTAFQSKRRGNNLLFSLSTSPRF